MEMKTVCAPRYAKAVERLTVLAERERIERAAQTGKAAPRPMAEWRLHDFRRACVIPARG